MSYYNLSWLVMHLDKMPLTGSYYKNVGNGWYAFTSAILNGGSPARILTLVDKVLTEDGLHLIDSTPKKRVPCGDMDGTQLSMVYANDRGDKVVNITAIYTKKAITLMMDSLNE